MSLLRSRRLGLAACTLLGGATTAVCLERRPGLFDATTFEKPVSGIIALVRFARSLGTASVVMADYRLLFARHSEYASERYKAERAVVHGRSANRLLALARRQGAVYVKIGQHVASMNHAVPVEYSGRLKLLEDRAAYRGFQQIKRAVEEEIGTEIGVVFEEFETVPVAAASLAQVHKGVLKGGERVAVKVQYPGLEALVEGDLKSIRMLNWLLKRVFPYFEMGWVVEQFRKNLKMELDFELEARSAEKTGILFAEDKRVMVPKVFTGVSTKKLLIMEYVDGFRVDDVEAMRVSSINPCDVANTVVEAFAKMIFLDGFIHLDPHPGNIMVKPTKGGYEVFLLDHGLYRQLDDTFRQSYCKLWKGLVLRRGKDVEDACAELDAPGFANVFSMFLLNRSWRLAKQYGTDIRVKMNSEELQQLRNDLKEGGLRSQADVSAFVERIPDDLLLVFKMNSLVRNVNKALGASVNRFKVNARYAVRGLRRLNGHIAEEGQTADDGTTTAVIVAGTHSEFSETYKTFTAVTKWFCTMMDCVVIEIHLFFLDAALHAVKWWLGGSLMLENGGQNSTTDTADGTPLIG